MKTLQSYSKPFKENLLQKVFQPGAPAISSIAKSANMPTATLYQWVSDARKKAGTSKMSNKKSNFSGELKLQAIINLTSMGEQELGQYFRSSGLYRSQVEEWKKEAQSLMSSKQTNSQKIINANEKLKDNKIKQLEKDLRQKEKALAEASSLLILKKKAHLIWGEEDD